MAKILIVFYCLSSMSKYGLAVKTDLTIQKAYIVQLSQQVV